MYTRKKGDISTCLKQKHIPTKYLFSLDGKNELLVVLQRAIVRAEAAYQSVFHLNVHIRKRKENRHDDEHKINMGNKKKDESKNQGDAPYHDFCWQQQTIYQEMVSEPIHKKNK